MRITQEENPRLGNRLFRQNCAMVPTHKLVPQKDVPLAFLNFIKPEISSIVNYNLL